MDFQTCIRLCEPIESIQMDRETFNALKRSNINHVFEIYKAEETKGIVKSIRGIGHKRFITLSIDLQHKGYPSLIDYSETTKGRVRT